MYKFQVDIAGVPILIKCRYKKNYEMFRDYYSQREAILSIEPTEEDFKKMQAGFERFAQTENIENYQRSPAFLEQSAIHTLIAEKLTEHNVLLMHGSALCMDGQAYIFTAKSGTGKSTHARLWRESFGNRVWMINDDKPMIRIDEMRVYGTPWDGKHHLNRNASAPLKAIVNLHRDETNHITPISKADAFTVLMKQAYISENPATMMQIIKMERKLLETVDFYDLGCNMNPEAAEVARKGICT